MCKQKKCSWELKSQKCSTISLNDDDSGEADETLAEQNSGNLEDLTNFSGLNGLRSIMRELALTNHGNINVNFILR